MVSWVLVIYIFAGPMAKGDNVTITNIGGFHSPESCEAAGQQSQKLTENSLKLSRFLCVEVK